MPDYTVEWIATPGDLYARMMMLLDMANGMFLITHLHIAPGKWVITIMCDKSIEHVRAMFTQYLREDFPDIAKTIHITQLKEQ